MDLFPSLPETLSPRLRWMRKHGITTQRLSPAIEGLPSLEAEVWKVGPSGVGRRITATGDTEDAALTALALAAGIRLWFEESPERPVKVFNTPDSGEMAADPNGHPRCPDCNGQVMQCGIDAYKCRKCGEGWTMTPIE